MNKFQLIRWNMGTYVYYLLSTWGRQLFVINKDASMICYQQRCFYYLLSTRIPLLFVINKEASIICYQQEYPYYLLSTRRPLLFVINKETSFISYLQEDLISLLSKRWIFIYQELRISFICYQQENDSYLLTIMGFL